MNKAVLDTDTLSALMRQIPAAVAQGSEYLRLHPSLTISIVTRYEVLRGLEAKSATTQLAAFLQLCNSIEVLPLTDHVIDRAASIYGDLHRRGQLIGDADILIAATCLDSGWELVTNNQRHFERIPGLTSRNWLLS